MLQGQLRLPAGAPLDPQLMLMAGLSASTSAGAVSVDPMDPTSQLRNLLLQQQHSSAALALHCR